MFSKEIFCERLKVLRTARQLSQQQVAEALGTTKQTISRWESGEREPNLASLYALAVYYEVSTDYLLGKSEHNISSGLSIL